MVDIHPRQGRGGRPHKSTSGAALNWERLTWRHIPQAEDFGDGEFLESLPLRELGERLIQEYDELNWLADYSVRYLWKASGGKSSGNPTLGKCILTSGLVLYFAHVDWVIWLGADWLREFEFNEDKVEALLYHELLHPVLKEQKEGKPPKPGARGHDFEDFTDVIRRYGFWFDNLQRVKKAVQGRLALEAQP
ncbi:MAG: hypothetical protein IPH53_20480 [Flavobacteriales bacterium]|nr:hypothetical protein [Flavobacteriales bacterium]